MEKFNKTNNFTISSKKCCNATKKQTDLIIFKKLNKVFFESVEIGDKGVISDTLVSKNNSKITKSC